MLSTPVWGVDIKNEAADPLLAPWLRRYAVTGITPQEQSGKGTPNNDAKKMLEKDFLPKYFEIISTVNRIDNIPDIKKPTTVIVDPPRPGLHLNTVKNLLRLSPEKIIYVSCNPATMARDIGILINEKYTIKDLQPIDMFPHTPHIECVTTLILN